MARLTILFINQLYCPGAENSLRVFDTSLRTLWNNILQPEDESDKFDYRCFPRASSADKHVEAFINLQIEAVQKSFVYLQAL